MFKNYIFIFVLMLCVSCGPTIFQEHIVFDQEREDLTIEYMKEHYGIEQETPTIVPKMVVVHWTEIPTFQKTIDAFYDTHLPSSRKAISGAGSLNVSSQFVIDRDGLIYSLMPETTMARHVIGLNHCAIGIENVGGPDMPLTKAQLNANVKLIKYLKRKYPIEYVIGHYEYQRFENTELWLEKDKGYRTVKTDPNKEFMEAIRNRTAQLNFKPIPN
ncbi:N-acetylmuramoyl-L-alanine amidase [Joostella sp. CR20]